MQLNNNKKKKITEEYAEHAKYVNNKINTIKRM